MKYIIRILLAIVLGLIGIGFYIKQTDIEEGRFYIGIGVVTLAAFVLMPLFIYHSYKGKDLSKYTFIVDKEKDEEEEEETEEQQP